MTHAVAYIRRSSPDERDGGGEMSKADQLDAYASLATQYGVAVSDVYTDWGRSADEMKVERRPQYLALLKAMEAGEVSHVFGLALDRFDRATAHAGRFARAVQDHDIIVHTVREGNVRITTPAEWLQWQILATFREYDLRVMKSRAQANMARRRKRDDYIGYAPYGSVIDRTTHKLVPRDGEDVSAVIEAFQRAKSFGGAAWLLNEDATLRERAKPRRGSAWRENTVARVVRRAGEAPLTKRRGWSKQRAESAAKTYALYHLLVCPHDGSRLTGMTTKSSNGTPHNRYFCSRARQDPSHPRPYAVAESIVLPWVLERIAKKRRTTRTQTITSSDRASDRAALDEEKRRLGVAYRANAMTDNEFAVEVARIDAALAELPVGEDDLSLTLRFETGSPLGLLERVVLDSAMRPTSIVWR